MLQMAGICLKYLGAVVKDHVFFWANRASGSRILEVSVSGKSHLTFTPRNSVGMYVCLCWQVHT